MALLARSCATAARLVLIAGVLGGAACTQGTAAAAPARPRLERREPLRPLARSVIKKQMGLHGKDMEALLAAVIALDYERSAALGEHIAAEPRVARPGGDLDSANALFPPAFFDQQDRLHVAAARLAVAARARDPATLSAGFSDLTATCVACHAAYLEMPGE